MLYDFSNRKIKIKIFINIIIALYNKFQLAQLVEFMMVK